MKLKIPYLTRFKEIKEEQLTLEREQLRYIINIDRNIYILSRYYEEFILPSLTKRRKKTK